MKRPQIAILRALRLGDLLCAVPALRALRAGRPDAEIAIVGLPWSRAFVRRFSRYVDRFIEFPGWPGLPERVPQLEEVGAFLSRMQDERFELAIQMHGSGVVTNPLVAAFGAGRTAGLFVPGQFCPDPDSFFPYVDGEHEVRQCLRLVNALGFPPRGDDLEFPILHSDLDALKSVPGLELGNERPYVCLHPGASNVSKCWPPARFARVGDHLAEIGFEVVITGMPAEVPITRAVAEHMRHPVTDVAPHALPLGPLAALLSGAEMLVSNDTGVAHIAAAVRLPSVIVFVTADPARWRPLDDARHRVLDGRSNAADAIAAAHEILAAVPAARQPARWERIARET